MLIVKIMNEFLHGPVWTYEDGIVTNDPNLISDDMVIKQICEQIEDMFSAYYEFNSHGQACWFNHDQEKADKHKMLSLITQLIERLNEINDGSFVIEDLETERLKNL